MTSEKIPGFTITLESGKAFAGEVKYEKIAEFAKGISLVDKARAKTPEEVRAIISKTIEGCVKKLVAEGVDGLTKKYVDRIKRAEARLIANYYLASPAPGDANRNAARELDAFLAGLYCSAAALESEKLSAGRAKGGGATPPKSWHPAADDALVKKLNSVKGGKWSHIAYAREMQNKNAKLRDAGKPYVEYPTDPKSIVTYWKRCGLSNVAALYARVAAEAAKTATEAVVLPFAK